MLDSMSLGFQTFRMMAVVFDNELEKIIKADSTIDIGDRAIVGVRLASLTKYSEDEFRNKVRQIKENYIKNVLPNDFAKLLPSIKFSNQGEEKTYSYLDIIEALFIRNPQHLTFPADSKNYTIEYRVANTGEFGISIPEVTLIDKETKQKWVISCGLGHIDWLKILNVETERTQEQFEIVSNILAKRNGALKISCNDGVLTYTGETQVENRETHKMETRQVTRNNFDGILSLVSNQYLMRMIGEVKESTTSSNL